MKFKGNLNKIYALMKKLEPEAMEKFDKLSSMLPERALNKIEKGISFYFEDLISSDTYIEVEYTNHREEAELEIGVGYAGEKVHEGEEVLLNFSKIRERDFNEMLNALKYDESATENVVVMIGNLTSTNEIDETEFEFELLKLNDGMYVRSSVSINDEEKRQNRMIKVELSDFVNCDESASE